MKKAVLSLLIIMAMLVSLAPAEKLPATREYFENLDKESRLEDIVEEIVGNIQDEYDEEEEMIVKQAENVYIVDGMAQLDDLEDILHIDFEEEDYDTLNGYLIECLDRIPAEDEQFVLQFEGYDFTILSVDKNTIKKVKIEKR